MRGCLTTIVFLLITSGLSTFMFGSAFFIAVLLDPDAPSIFELQWHTNVILLVYLIVFHLLLACFLGFLVLFLLFLLLLLY